MTTIHVNIVNYTAAQMEIVAPGNSKESDTSEVKGDKPDEKNERK